MILWTLTSFGLFYGAHVSKNRRTRRNCTVLFSGFMLGSVILLMLGTPPVGYTD